MHGDETPRVLVEVHYRVSNNSHRGHLELHLHQLRIEQFKQDFVGEPAVDPGEFKPFVVQELLNARPGRHFSDLVVLVRRLLDGIHGGDAVLHGPVQAGRTHLRHANALGPVNRLLLLVSEFIQVKVGARALQPVVFHDLPGLFGVREAGELLVPRRAQLQAPNSQGGHVLAQPRKVTILDPLPVGIGLAPDRQPERIGAKFPGADAQEPGHCGIHSRLLEKLSS